MPDDGTKRSRPSWKRTLDPAPKPAEPTHEWSTLKVKRSGAAERPWSGSVKVACAVVGSLACLAVIVALIMLLMPPESTAVVLVGADYADNLLVPHNALGWEGLAGIEKISKTRPRLSLFPAAALPLIRTKLILDQADKWDALIEDLRKKPFREKTILIVVALHGASDSKSAYLIPDRMAGPEDRLELSHVIQSMGQLPPEKRKILVLEGAQVPANWQLGMLHNDFARRLSDLEPEIKKIENLWVLSAADIDQRCWVSEGLGRTVFSHYLIEALQGKASSGDGELTLDDLHDYVFTKVRDWVWNARGAIQEPVLLPAAVDPGDGDTKKQAGGIRRVASRANRVVLATVDGSNEPQTSAAPDRDGLKTLWERFHRLDSMIPHPSVYSPRRWRQYRAELVRFEELVEAGASSKAGPVRERFEVLDRLLDNERFLRGLPGSIENTLAMNAVTGGTIEAGSISTPGFLEFWKGRPLSDAARAWEKLKASEIPGSDARPSLRIRMDAFLLQRAIEDPAQHLRPAADKLLITRGSDFPQPAEVHFLRMIALWPETSARSASQFWSLVKQALTVRQRAEQAALAAAGPAGGCFRSEQIYPWIKARIEAGDLERRNGEDLLFASEKAAWDQSATAFGQAARSYDEAVEGAAAINAALAVRDRALAILPDYSRWMAHRYSDELQDDLNVSLEKLWESTHRLSGHLEKPGDTIAEGFFAPASKALAMGLEKLAQRFRSETSRVETERLQGDWEVSTAASAVPFADSSDLSLRTKIWDRLDNIQKHDRELAKLEPVRISDNDRLQEARHVERRARIEGLMSMAALGPRWFDDPDVFKSELGDHASTLTRIGHGPIDDALRSKTSWHELALAGDLIGERWRQLVPEIERLVSEEKGLAKFGEFQDRLIKADRLGRQLDGGSKALEESFTEATGRLRETRVHDLLLRMAERAWRDHWYDENPKEKPYYQVTGASFISDASKLMPQSQEVSVEKERLALTGKLELDGLPTQVLSSERSIGLSYTVVPKGVLPEHGHAVIRPIPDRDIKLEDEQKRFQAVSRDAKRVSIDFTVQSPLIPQFEKTPSLERPQLVESSLKVEGSFRGQVFERTTRIEVHPVPDTVAIGPPVADPPQAHIAVRASKEIISIFGDGNGSIAIVLDCSGSMLDPANAPKFPQAVRALESVLQFVPKGTKVSLWTFSQLPDNIPLGPDYKLARDVRPELRAEFDKLGEEPELTIHALREAAPWSVAETEGLIRQLHQIRPFFDTPLAQAMWNAAGQDLVGAKGLKTLLVLTDGKDTRLDRSPKYNPENLSVADFVVKHLKPLNVQVNMIFFTPETGKKEIDVAKTNFQGALNRLEPRGSFVTADNLAELKETLKRGIKQKLTYHLLKPDGSKVSEEPFDVTGPGDADKWSKGLAPGIYTLRVLADMPYDKEIRLEAGDWIVVDLIDDASKGIAFRRALYSGNEKFANAANDERNDWRMSVLANKLERRVRTEELQIVAALERKHVNLDMPIQQIRPRLAWFRVEAEDIERPEEKFSVRWHERMFYPGPVWQFDVPRWINDAAGAGMAKPTLKAWWRERDRPDGPSPARHFRLTAAGDVRDLPRPCTVDDGKTVLIESIEVEEHPIEIWPGKPLQNKSCLVVRIANPENSPYIIDPEALVKAGLDIAGYEHRLYSRANKYAGLFWPVNESQVQKLTKLSLISLDALKNEALKQNNTAKIMLNKPKEDDHLPIPMVPDGPVADSAP